LHAARIFIKSTTDSPDEFVTVHMRAEAQAIADNIKQSLELLRRHL
jgi:hypothetical protein